MGIAGLIPFLSKSSRHVNIKEYEGQTVAVDAYCWLHKGAFSCAEKLVMNEPTLQYVSYCMKFVNMLLSYNVKPVLVFDGRYLPAKAETEKKRRENRAINRKKGAELLKAGQCDESKNYLRRSVDITHEMALNLMKACRKKNVDCIVAPYEADAQLAYMNKQNLAYLVITEDSDLLLFGCVRVLFKMDISGNGILIEKERLHISMGIRHDKFSMDKFRYMCILSGCDYLPSLPGIGLSKARKFINRISEQNIYEALLKLPVNLRMWTLVVTDDYRKGFIEADKTFKYQLVYDPIRRKQVALNETEREDDIVGEKLDENVAFELALGNLDPMTLRRVDCYNPDEKKTPGKVQMVKALKMEHKSIWDRNFSSKAADSRLVAVHSPTKGRSIIANVSLPVKRPFESDWESDTYLTKEYLFSLYAKGTKKPRRLNEADTDGSNEESGLDNGPPKSPVLYTKRNPFAMKSSLTVTAKKRCLRFNVEPNSGGLLDSRYFQKVQNISENICNEDETSFSDTTAVEESPGELSDQEKSGITQQKNTESARKEISNSDGNDVASDVRIELSHFSILCQKRVSPKAETLVEVEANRDCQLEDIPKASSEIQSVDVSEKKCGSVANQVSEKTILSPVTSIPDGRKKLYDCGTSGEQTSPYFPKNKDSNFDASVRHSRVQSCDRRISWMKNKKRCVAINSASKCSRGKQSLLTRFGFQPRQKIQNEAT